MLKANEYFDGKVRSIGFEDNEGLVTVGVMEPGNYTFSTDAKELMIVVTGALTVKRPGDAEWVSFPAGQFFPVPASSSFEVRVDQPTVYLCRYG